MSNICQNINLPITHETITTIVEKSPATLEVVEKLAAPELAALVFLQQIAGPKAPRDNLQTHYAGILKVCHQQTEQEGTSRLARHLCNSMQADKLEAGLGLVEELGIVLKPTEFKQNQYARQIDLSGGNSDWIFQPASTNRIAADGKPIVITTNGRAQILAFDQNRIYREVAVQYDENLHIQGYAGTGKTALIRFLFNLYDKHRARVLVLGDTERQLAALDPGSYDHQRVHFRTFAALSRELIPHDYLDPVYSNLRRRNNSHTPVTDIEICKLLGIPENEILARYIRQTMYKFCQSTDSEVSERSMPLSVSKAALDAPQKAAIVEYARRLWDYHVLPNKEGIALNIAGDHRIKLATLHGWLIPDQYTHILIDECHNLSGAKQKLLSLSPQAVVTLGDDYQSLRGTPAFQPEVIRLREMTESIRSGSGVDAILNPMISLHPNPRKNRFKGNPNHRLEISYYNRHKLPKEPCVILANDLWGLFEWVQRLSAERMPITLLSNSQQLDVFVSDCIELYQHGIRPRHGSLFRYKRWSDVFQDNSGNPSCIHVNRMLESGYDNKNWDEVKTLLKADSNRLTFKIGLIADARNHEFDSVMLTPLSKQPKDSKNLSVYINHLYTAITRARRKLLLHEDMRDWIEEISSSLHYS